MAKHCTHSARATAASHQLRSINNPALLTADSHQRKLLPKYFQEEFELQSYLLSVRVSTPTDSIQSILTHSTNGTSKLLTERTCGAGDHRAEYEGYSIQFLGFTRNLQPLSGFKWESNEIT